MLLSATAAGIIAMEIKDAPVAATKTCSDVFFSLPLHLKIESPQVVLKALTFISSIEASFCASLSLRRSDTK